MRIVERPPPRATRYEMEHLCCNGCGQVFTAEVPADSGAEKRDETAAAMIAQLHYGSGVPFQRLERQATPEPIASDSGTAPESSRITGR